MKRLFRFFMVFLLIGMFMAGAAFIALAMYYRDNFPVNTWINGVYCTGRTVQEVNEELALGQGESVISIVDGDGTRWEMDMGEAGVRPDYTEQLKSYLQTNASFYWLKNLGKTVSDQLWPKTYELEDEKLRKAFEELPFVKEELGRGQGGRVCCAEGGYYLQDDNENRLNVEKAYSCLRENLKKGNATLLMQESGCYEKLPDSAADLEQRDLWGQICSFTDRCGKIVYDMGAEKIPFTPEVASGFLKREDGSQSPWLDESGNIVIDDDKVRAWVTQLAEEYDTWKTEREFQTTRGDVVKVTYDTYGTQLDDAAETKYLLEALRTDFSETQVHIPAYSHQGFARGLDDIGDTYIEIDMTEQKMYYYADGELALETEVVTGDTGKRMGTPSGVNFVYHMQRDRILRGSGYASFVKYWMPIKGGVGIHDAGWRKTFGGEIYKNNGSDGCINTPTDIMGELYEMAQVGTPVITFY